MWRPHKRKRKRRRTKKVSTESRKPLRRSAGGVTEKERGRKREGEREGAGKTFWEGGAEGVE